MGRGRDKDIEFSFKLKMSKRLALILAVGGWLWGFFSTLYFSYVAMTGNNPVIDYTIGLPGFLTYALGILGIWGLILSSLVGALLVMAIGAVIVKFRE